MLTTFIVEAPDSFALLERVAQLFRRKQAQVQYLTFANRRANAPARVAVVVDVDQELGARLERSLWKLIDVSSVTAVRDVETEDQTA